MGALIDQRSRRPDTRDHTTMQVDTTTRVNVSSPCSTAYSSPPDPAGPTGQPGDPPRAMPMIGLASGMAPVEPWNTAPGPKVKMPPSEATR